MRFLPDDNLLLGLDKTLVTMNINTNELDSVIDHNGRLTEVLVQGNLVISSGIFLFYFLDDNGFVYIRSYENRSDMNTIRF